MSINMGTELDCGRDPSHVDSMRRKLSLFSLCQFFVKKSKKITLQLRNFVELQTVLKSAGELRWVAVQMSDVVIIKNPARGGYVARPLSRLNTLADLNWLIGATSNDLCTIPLVR